MKDKITVLIADDNPEFAKTLTGYIEEDNEFEIIAIARDGKEAVEMITSTEPQVAINGRYSIKDTCTLPWGSRSIVS